MNVHHLNARAWGLCWIVAAIIASIPTDLTAETAASLLTIRTGDTCGEYFLGLAEPGQAEAQVDVYIERYLTLGRVDTERILGRAEIFFPGIEASLEEAGLPNALKYLPMVESTLLPEVISPSGAAGIWQLMPVTARFFGLTVNEHLDERFDPNHAAKAATGLLKMLHKDFGDWLLVLAAYNCGPGRVRKAITKAGSLEYQVLKPYLPKQTRSYISKFLAMAYVAHSFEAHQLTPKKSHYKPLYRKAVQVESSGNFSEIAKRLGMSIDDLRALNPAYRSGELAEGIEKQTIFVPPHLSWKLTSGYVVQQDAVATTKTFQAASSGFLSHSGTLTNFSLFPKIGFQQHTGKRRTHTRLKSFFALVQWKSFF